MFRCFQKIRYISLCRFDSYTHNATCLYVQFTKIYKEKLFGQKSAYLVFLIYRKYDLSFILQETCPSERLPAAIRAPAFCAPNPANATAQYGWHRGLLIAWRRAVFRAGIVIKIDIRAAFDGKTDPKPTRVKCPQSMA